MTPEVAELLACPHCGAALQLSAPTLQCARGHAFDIARQGYVNLAPTGSAATGDTAAMVAARKVFLAAGHFDPLIDAIAEAVTAAAPDAATVLDVGAGTGRHLAAVLERLPDATGLALDASKFAARAAAKAHPRAGAVVCDVWHGLPVRDAVADVVLGVFAPRNVDEVLRVLTPRGVFVVATPAPDHLAELAPLGLLRVDPDKRRRLDEALAAMATGERRHVTWQMPLATEDMELLVGMGPSAHHVDADEIRHAAAALSPPVAVTAAVDIAVHTRVSQGASP